MKETLSLKELRTRYDDEDPAQSSGSDAAGSAAACAQDGTQDSASSERCGNGARAAETRSEVGTPAATLDMPAAACEKSASESDTPTSDFSDLELQDYLELHDGAYAIQVPADPPCPVIGFFCLSRYLSW